MIIGISGKIKTGKDTAGDFLKTLSAGKMHKVSFGWGVKTTAAHILGISPAMFEDHGFKETPMGPEWDRIKYAGRTLPSSLKIDPQITPHLVKQQMLYRQLLQDLGTGLRDTVHPDIWLNHLELTLNTAYFGKDVYATDVRFPNEVKFIESRGGIVVRLERDYDLRGVEGVYSPEILNSESETALDNYDFGEFVIHNNDSLEYLETQMKKVYDEARRRSGSRV